MGGCLSCGYREGRFYSVFVYGFHGTEFFPSDGWGYQSRYVLRSRRGIEGSAGKKGHVWVSILLPVKYCIEPLKTLST